MNSPAHMRGYYLITSLLAKDSVSHEDLESVVTQIHDLSVAQANTNMIGEFRKLALELTYKYDGIVEALDKQGGKIDTNNNL